MMPQLKEIMTPSVEVVSPNATAADVARKMLDLDVGAIPVCDGENLLGMVTDRDLVLRVMAVNRDPVQARVSEAMTKGLVYSFEDEDAEVAADLMAKEQIRRLPVLSREKRLVGIVSLGDLVVDGLDAQTSGAVLHDVSDPSRSQR
jgi:CBS domain-containing protein